MIKEAIHEIKDTENNINIEQCENNALTTLNSICDKQVTNLSKIEQEIEEKYLNHISNCELEEDEKLIEYNKEVEDKMKSNDKTTEKKGNNSECKILREHKSNEPFEKRLDDITKRQMKKIQESKSFKEISKFTIHKVLYKKIYPQIVEKAILLENERVKSLKGIETFELILNYKTEVILFSLDFQFQ